VQVPGTKPVYRKAVDVVATALRPSVKTQDGRELPFSPKMGYRVNTNKEDFDAIEQHFKETKDAQGRSMLELSRRYWNDPEYRAQINAEIMEAKARGKR
jgi:hypothetical protein